MSAPMKTTPASDLAVSTSAVQTAKSKTLGFSSEATIIMSIKPGGVPGENRTYRVRLEHALESIARRASEGLETPVSLLKTIHFARWNIYDQTPPAGPLLIFTVSFDGRLKHYFRRFSHGIPDDVDRIFRNCEGYPEDKGAKDFDALWQFVKQHQVEAQAFYSAFPHLTLTDIKNLELFKRNFDAWVEQNLNDDGSSVLEASLNEFVRASRRIQPADSIAAPLDKTSHGCSQERACAQGATLKPDSQCQVDAKQEFEQILLRIQPNILRSHCWKHTRYHFIRIDDPEQFRPALAAALKAFPAKPAAAFNVNKETNPTQAINVAFTHQGLRKLKVDPLFLDEFSEAFREGMAARSDRLGDDAESAPAFWERFHGSEDVHVLISFFYVKQDDVDASWKAFVESQSGTTDGADACLLNLPGSHCLVVENGKRLFENNDETRAPIEHFGFRDGISQPALRDGSSSEGGGWLDKDESWKPVEMGEFLLGHKDMDGFDQLAPTPELKSLFNDGTYLVFRKLQQRVDEFNKFLDEKLEPAERELMTARMVGRWKNGNSLVDYPAHPGEAAPSASENGFRYKPDDDSGMRCPFASHVRRINPRDSHPDRGVDPKAVARRRVIRRGIPYGDPQDESADKGLLFFCFNARIDTQFEFLQEEWVNRGDFMGHNSSDKDPIIGSNGGDGDVLTFPEGPIPSPKLPRFVITRGGEYFFMPSISALTGLLEGEFSEDTVPELPDSRPAMPTDPVRYAECLDVAALHASKNIDLLKHKRVSHNGHSSIQNWYYFVGYDQIVDVLDDDSHFTVDHTSRRVEALLRDPGSRQPDFEKQMLLGLPGGHDEKKKRHAILRDAFKCDKPDVSGLFKAVEEKLEDAAYDTAQLVISKAETPTGSIKIGFNLDVARDLARRIPLQRVEQYYGMPLPDKISDLHKAWYFRQIPECDRKLLQKLRSGMKERGEGPSEGLAEGLIFEDLNWIENFPAAEDPTDHKEPGRKELEFLAHASATTLLIDVYNTGELFDIGWLAIRQLRRHVSDCVDRASMAKAPAIPGTLLDDFLKNVPSEKDSEARDLYLRRVKLLLLEMIVGGVETPAKGIVNTINALLSYPEAMAAARSAVQGNNREALDDVILEALRLDPVAVLLYRFCPNEATLSKANNAVIKPGSMIALVLRAGYRDPAKFKNPNTFQLEREVRAKDPGFGRDPHGCVGRLIAMAEIRGVVRALLNGYELQRVPGVNGRKQERFRWPVNMGVKLYRGQESTRRLLYR